MSQPSQQQLQKANTCNKSEKTKDIRLTNIQAAKAVSDAIRTSLRPRGMDKMIQDAKREVLIINDGATILKQMDLVHPTAKMLKSLMLKMLKLEMALLQLQYLQEPY